MTVAYSDEEYQIELFSSNQDGERDMDFLANGCLTREGLVIYKCSAHEKGLHEEDF
jgi:hypothetical protein